MSERLVLNPEATLDEAAFYALLERFNEGRTLHKARNEIRVVEGYVIKAFRPPNLLRRLGYAFRRTKAEASYHNGLRLLSLGVATPEPIGFLLKNEGTRLFSYYVSRYLPHDFTLQKPLRDFHFPQREEILRAFGSFTAELHQKGIWHKDYSQGNILISQTPQGWRFALVDVNRMRFGPVSVAAGPKNFSKLWIDEATMRTVVLAYAKARGIDEKTALQTALKADASVKRAKNFRRSLRHKLKNV